MCMILNIKMRYNYIQKKINLQRLVTIIIVYENYVHPLFIAISLHPLDRYF